MLDPFTGLSLAAAIAQFIEFACKIFSEAEAIYKKEASSKSVLVGFHPDRIAALADNIRELRRQLPRDSLNSDGRRVSYSGVCTNE
jgi:hypothetical protein